MGLFDRLFESEESKAERLRKQKEARLVQEIEQKKARQHQEKARREQEGFARVKWFKEQARVETVEIFKNTSVEFCYVPPGQFKMGEFDHLLLKEWETNYTVDVKISVGFWLGRVPVTQAIWKSVTGQNPCHFEGSAELPVESVSWEDCAGFLGLLKKSHVLGGQKYSFDFPTEAQWEHACRAGTLRNYGVEKVWANQKHPIPVGQLPGNALGLQDMHGNVWEWCRDYYEVPVQGGVDPCRLPPAPPAIRPRAWTPPGVSRAVRGGSWSSYFSDEDNRSSCSASERAPLRSDSRRNDVGFRLALVPSS